MQGARYSPYKRNAFMAAVREGRIERVREIINSREPCYTQEWRDGHSLLRTAVEKKRSEVAKLLLTSGAKVNSRYRSPTNTPLHHAVLNGDTEIIQMLLDKGANIDAQNTHGKTPLHNAMQTMNTEIINILLNQSANINVADKSDLTPLHLAILNNSKEIINLFLSRGANIDGKGNNATTSGRIAASTGDGSAPLHLAVERANNEITELLLRSGANVDARRNNGATSLHIATEGRNSKIIGYLLKYGANVNSTYTSTSRKGYTSLHLAVENGSKDMIKLLLSNGADVNAKAEQGTTSLHLATEHGYLEIAKLLLKYGAYVNSVYTSTTLEGYTSLHLAAQKGSKAFVETLLSRLADVNAKGRDGKTSLHIALEEEYFHIAELVLKHGACVQAVYTSAPREGYTPLHLAVEKGAEDIVKLILSKGADANARGKYDTTSLHLATQYGYLKIVEHLLKHGADVHSTSQQCPTALYLAVENRHEKIVKLLLEYGSDVNFKHKDDRTILHLAVKKGCPIIVEDILKHCPDLNDESNCSVLCAAMQGCGAEYNKIVKQLLQYGFIVTPNDPNEFMLAAIEKNYVNILEELLNRGADANKLYNSTLENGSIPLHVAIKSRYEEAAKLLISYGADVNAPDETGKTPIFYATENVDVKMTKLLLTHEANARDNPELLRIAVKKDCREIVEVLLQHGADVNAIDECGRMPLHFIVMDEERKRFGFPRRDPDAKGEVARLLLSRGADPNTRVENSTTLHWKAYANTRCDNSMTMLHAAIDKGYVKVVEALLEYNADVNSTFDDDTTPLHLAAERGSKVITKMLLNKGADSNAEQRSGMTALFFATESGHKEVVELLIKCGAKIDARKKSNLMTPLHIAAEFGHLNVVMLLLKLGASVDSTDKSGTTPLHNACRKGREDIVTVLLEHGSDITIKSKDNYTALNFAMKDYDYDGYDDDAFDYDDYDEDVHEDPRVNVVEVLKRHMVKLRTANLYTGHDDLLSISSISTVDEEELSDFEDEYDDIMECRYGKRIRRERRLSRNYFQNKCDKEIAIMKSEKVANTNVTFYDILMKGVSQVAMYARNESIVAAFASDDYEIKFPIYASILNSSFKKGKKKNELLEEGNKIVCVLFNDLPGLPRDCIERILGYLNDEDLSALMEAGKPSVYCQQS